MTKIWHHLAFIFQVIFNAASSKESMQSFSMPFFCMREIELEQPIFGANYIKGRINAEQGGITFI